MNKTIYTIGHSTRPVEKFIEVLKTLELLGLAGLEKKNRLLNPRER